MTERTALIQARERTGLKRAQLARLMGGSRHYVYAVEMGLRDPSFDFMERWVKALGYPATLKLFAREPPPEAPPKRPVGRPRRLESADNAAE